MVKSIVRTHKVMGKVQYVSKRSDFEYYIITKKCVN